MTKISELSATIEGLKREVEELKHGEHGEHGEQPKPQPPMKIKTPTNI